MKTNTSIWIAIMLAFCSSFSPLSAQEDDENRKRTFEETWEIIRDNQVNLDEQAMIARKNKKLDAALENFLETSFIKKFKDTKLETESLVAAFKAHSQEYSPADVRKVRLAYDRMAEEFNRLLAEVKRDFSDRKTVRNMKDNPTVYSNAYELQLRNLREEYFSTFERAVIEVTGSDLYAAVPLGAILGMIKLAQEFVDFLARSSYEAKRINEELLYTYLMEPYSFKKWDDILMGEGSMYNQNNYRDSDSYEEDNDQIRLFDDTGKASSPPKKKKN